MGWEWIAAAMINYTFSLLPAGGCTTLSSGWREVVGGCVKKRSVSPRFEYFSEPRAFLSGSRSSTDLGRATAVHLVVTAGQGKADRYWRGRGRGRGGHSLNRLYIFYRKLC